ncbi:MAG TPA: hypothetical protein DD001_07845 [Microcoleaceae bacterium UBA10368]|jgi:hypothetical protein|nr:hypothetical protein [Microcoleaceae cyanobacterium UBA10368]HCV30200.1 hypothetical protein [Microcoleaceae cyanobacterium UBA9251]
MLGKVRYNDSYGLDLEQVLAWKRVPTQYGELLLSMEEWDLEVYVPGNKIVFKKDDDGFKDLIDRLRVKFMFNLPTDAL